jgi:hypothetical protein
VTSSNVGDGTARRLRKYNAIVRRVAFESDGGAVGLLRAREDLKCAAFRAPSHGAVLTISEFKSLSIRIQHHTNIMDRVLGMRPINGLWRG